MLAIRLQRTGRKGHAQYRMIVQDSHRAPTSERVVYRLGHYNPHTKELVIDKEKTSFYLEHGAQPSDRVARLLKNDGVKLPAWVKISDPIKRDIRNPEKLRKNRPEEPKEEAPAAEEPTPEQPAPEAEAPAEAPKEEKAEQKSEDNPETKDQ